jgi:hypothetical protein
MVCSDAPKLLKLRNEILANKKLDENTKLRIIFSIDQARAAHIKYGNCDC